VHDGPIVLHPGVVPDVPGGAAHPTILIALGKLRYTVHHCPPIVVAPLSPPQLYSLAAMTADVTVAVAAEIAKVMAAGTKAVATTSAPATLVAVTMAAAVVAVLMVVASTTMVVTTALWQRLW
jgi:hypothetical protein